jgi:hypothetical protein
MVISSPVAILVNPAVPNVSAAPLPSVSAIPSTPTTIGHDGNEGDFSTHAALTMARSTQTNNLVDTKAYYDISFKTSTAGTIKHVKMSFPVGTFVGDAVLVQATGIGSGTIQSGAGGNTIAYTVTNAVHVPAGVTFKIQLANINNPLNPNNAFTISITTRDPSNAIIDGPTSTSAYNMKQINAGGIANNAVTTPKIADESITSTKPAESYEKRIILLDDANGNALGWNPDGMATAFNILAPVDENSFVSIMLPRTCSVAFGLDIGFFTFHCDTAPPENSKLNYLITNLPVHINE